MTVSELFDIVLPRIANSKQAQSLNFIEALQVAVDIVTQRLWLCQSDMLRSVSDVDVAAGDDSVVVPFGFLGMIPDVPPVIDYGDDRKDVLEPLPKGTRHTIGEDGDPKYYELRGGQIRLLPSFKDAAGTVAIEYFKRPDVITSFDDDVPFNGVFDALLTDAVVMVGQRGLSITVDQGFAAYLAAQVDRFANLRPMKSVRWRYSL